MKSHQRPVSARVKAINSFCVRQVRTSACSWRLRWKWSFSLAFHQLCMVIVHEDIVSDVPWERSVQTAQKALKLCVSWSDLVGCGGEEFACFGFAMEATLLRRGGGHAWPQYAEGPNLGTVWGYWIVCLIKMIFFFFSSRCWTVPQSPVGGQRLVVYSRVNAGANTNIFMGDLDDGADAPSADVQKQKTGRKSLCDTSLREFKIRMSFRTRSSPQWPVTLLNWS